ncbi:hypothetical protein [Microbacterium dextranolyticum]|uniref:Uncharacterized protein n=1 Tax=Microbacterium dextranolyticum TaxID=36806 RepID=A0A9W6HNP8_9MICO|nr:hypothetical protein [Microbacterium dextranolyticum]MBM7462509.1 hypothetical protein [Microbacterium dextranolyticum]GLJ96368.1 hypothetical protein GCM10017591_24310 [Microbacterium dextranolyticum]
MRSARGGTTEPPELKTTLDALSRAQLAQLNYVMGRWGESRDPNITSAVAMFVWDVADHDVYLSKGGDGGLITRVPAGDQATVLSHLAAMHDAGASSAVKDPAVSLSIAMTDQYHGTLTIAPDPASLSGTVSLSNATFTDGSTSATLGACTHQILGTPAEGAPDYRVRATFTASSTGLGAGVDLFYTPGSQRILAAASFKPLLAQAESPVIPLDFQPVIETQVSSKFVQAGAPFVDQLAVTVTKHSWIKVNGSPVPVLAEGILYGPFDAQPAEANAPRPARPCSARSR